MIQRQFVILWRKQITSYHFQFPFLSIELLQWVFLTTLAFSWFKLIARSMMAWVVRTLGKRLASLHSGPENCHGAGLSSWPSLQLLLGTWKESPVWWSRAIVMSSVNPFDLEAPQRFWLECKKLCANSWHLFIWKC